MFHWIGFRSTVDPILFLMIDLLSVVKASIHTSLSWLSIASVIWTSDAYPHTSFLILSFSQGHIPCKDDQELVSFVRFRIGHNFHFFRQRCLVPRKLCREDLNGEWKEMSLTNVTDLFNNYIQHMTVCVDYYSVHLYNNMRIYGNTNAIEVSSSV